jgi:PAS domain S-box-containing protein
MDVDIESSRGRDVVGVPNAPVIRDRIGSEQRLAGAGSAGIEGGQQRRLYETIISSTPDLVYVFDLNARFIFANEALLQMWGRSLEESIGKSLLEIGYEPWHAEMHERELGEVIATKRPIRGEVAFPHAKLGRRIYDYIFVPVFDDGGEVEAIAGTTRDITEHKQTEQLLIEQTRLLEMIAAGRAVHECLSELCAVVTRLDAGTRACVLLTDQTNTSFEQVIAPHLPPAFREALAGVAIDARTMGILGGTLHVGEPASCASPESDDGCFVEWNRLCEAHGILAWHSTPIRDAQDAPRASFVLFFGEKRAPNALEHCLADLGTRIGSIALDRARSQEAVRQSELRLAADLEDAKLLQRISAKLIHQDRIATLNEEILDAATAIMRSDFASMQLLGPGRHAGGELRLLAHRGLTPEAAEFWKWVHTASGACGEALRTGDRVLILDIERCDFIADTDELAMYRRLGVRTVQITPLISRNGELLGMISTHWRELHEPSDRDLRLFDILVRQAADLLDRKRAEAALEEARRSAERARDQAERARSEAQAANQVKSDFLAAMSHEFRTPLNAIAGYLQLIELGVHGPVTAEQSEALARARKSQQHLLSLINDVLNFARLEAGRIEYAIDDLVLADVMSDVTTMVEQQLAAKRIAFEVRIDPEAVVRADREKLQQILLNLLSNATKFTAAGGRVSVRTHAGPGMPESLVSLQVADDGCGIPVGKLDEIFDPFVQVNRKLTQTPEGTGLGLAISRHLARAMGGDLRVQSEEGRGATFSVLLPRAGGSSIETRPPGLP